jgi:hypothetical protein
MCNLDVDNIFQNTFPSALAAHVRREVDVAHVIVRADREGLRDELFDLIVGLPAVGRGHAAGTTGRIALFGHDFVKIGGHDEDCIGVGYQDIDVLRRSEKMKEEQERLWPRVKVIREKWLALKTNVVNAGCGTCLLNFDGDSGSCQTPNELKARNKRDRGTAKISKVDPDVVQTWKTWHAMNQENVKVMQAKLKSGKIARNMGHDLPNWERTPREHLQAFFDHDIGACRHEQG